MTEGAVSMILRSPIYNGWVSRHRRSGTEQRQPAAWRANPPVSDALWEHVAEIRARPRSLHGGPWEPDPSDMLRGLLFCTCGTRIKSDGTMGTPPRRRKAHARHRDCADWGPQKGSSGSTYERWIAAQMSGLRFRLGHEGEDRPRADRHRRPGSKRAEGKDRADEARPCPRSCRRSHHRWTLSGADDGATCRRRDGPRSPADGRGSRGSRRVHRRESRDVGEGHARGVDPARAGHLRERARRLGLWRARQDSNLRPSAPEADALSAELQAHDAHAPGISAERSSPSHDVNGPNDTRSASGRPHGADPDGPGRPGRLRADHRKTQGASAMAEADVDDHPSPNPGRCSLASRATGVPFANRPPRGRGRSSSLDRAIQPGAAVSETAVPSFPDTTGSRRRAASSESRVICRPGMAPNAGNVEAAPEGAASMLSR